MVFSFGYGYCGRSFLSLATALATAQKFTYGRPLVALDQAEINDRFVPDQVSGASFQTKFEYAVPSLQYIEDIIALKMDFPPKK